ncbi:MAG: HD domain-containing phosphohydrolase [Nitrospirota bacterium]
MHKIFRDIRFKFSFFILILLIATTFVFYVMTAKSMDQHVIGQVVKRAEALSRSIASSAGYSFLAKDMLGLDNIVFQTKESNPDVEYIAIVGNDNVTVVHNDIGMRGGILKPADGKIFKSSSDGSVVREVDDRIKSFFEVYQPIVFMDKQLGAVILGVNRSALLKAQHEVRKRIILVFVATLFLGLVGSFILSSFITRPIKELSSGVAEMKAGKRSRPIVIYSRDELGRLTKNFNEMTALITEQRESLSKFALDLEESYVSTVKVLAAAIDARDSYTHGHATRVSSISLQLGRKIGLSPSELEELEIACLFHDVGKIKTPDSILRKNGRLDLSEREEMMRHTEYGTEILIKAPSLHKFIPVVRHHHEWHNGEGYPDGLSGDMIPLFASIISVADAFDAMTSDRPYRKALSEKNAVRELTSFSGKQFNPYLIGHFIEMIKENNFSGESYSTTWIS